jgi:phospholipid transport system substrate-binding protein
MKYKIISSMVMSLLASGPLYAATNPAPGASQDAMAEPPARVEQQETEPAMLVEQGMNKMLAFLNQEQRPDEDALMAFLGNEITLFFDFPYMAKSAAGPVYRHMDQQQRDRMSDNIQQQFLAAMAARLEGFDSQQVRVVSQRYGRGGYTAKVSVAVLQPQGYPARLDFRFYRAKTGWKVFDVSANGQSAVIHYRRQFREAMYATRYERQGLSRQHQMQRSFRHPTSH